MEEAFGSAVMNFLSSNGYRYKSAYVEVENDTAKVGVRDKETGKMFRFYYQGSNQEMFDAFAKDMYALKAHGFFAEGLEKKHVTFWVIFFIFMLIIWSIIWYNALYIN